MMNILFVCTGNTCRSPMAEGILRDMAEKKGMEIRVKSAGVFAYDGEKASKEAVEVMEYSGIDISNHRASLVHKKLMEEADLIITMSYSHKDVLIRKFPFAKEKVFTLKEYAHGVDGDVIDPFGRGIAAYSRTKNELTDSINQLIVKLND